jgi:hypothetical protein
MSGPKVFIQSDPCLLGLRSIPIAEIQGHELNPRPYSDRYQMRVHEERVNLLIANMQREGYDSLYPIEVRLLETGRYEIVVGHHRYCAARAIGYTEIPAIVLDIDRMQAAVRLMTRQGKGIEPWFAAEHAYHLCVVGDCSQIEYCRETGYEIGVVSKWISAYKVRMAHPDLIGDLSLTIARSIGMADSNDWQWLLEMSVELNLTTRQVQQAVKNLKALKIDPISEDWLDLPKLKKSIATTIDDKRSVEISKVSKADVDVRQKITELSPDLLPEYQRRLKEDLPESMSDLLDICADIEKRMVGRAIAGASSIDDSELVQKFSTILLFGTNSLIQNSTVIKGSLKRSGTIILVLGDRLDEISIAMKEANRLKLELNDRIIWRKNDSSLSPPSNRLQNFCSDILIFKRCGEEGIFRQDFFDGGKWKGVISGNLASFWSQAYTYLPVELTRFLTCTYVPKGEELLSIGGEASADESIRSHCKIVKQF